MARGVFYTCTNKKCDAEDMWTEHTVCPYCGKKTTPTKETEEALKKAKEL